MQGADIRRSAGNSSGTLATPIKATAGGQGRAEGQLLPSVGAYIQIFMVGRKPGGLASQPSSRRKGKGALGVATKAPSAFPESTHSQWCWLTSVLGNSQLRAGPRLRPCS